MEVLIRLVGHIKDDALLNLLDYKYVEDSGGVVFWDQIQQVESERDVPLIVKKYFGMVIRDGGMWVCKDILLAPEASIESRDQYIFVPMSSLSHISTETKTLTYPTVGDPDLQTLEELEDLRH